MSIPQHAAQAFHSAFSGIGTREKAVILCVKGATNEQLQDMQLAYNQMFNKSLAQTVRFETSFNFEKLVLSTLQPRYQLWAECIHHAVAGLGTDEKRLIYYVFMMDDYDKQQVRLAYQQKYRKTLDHAIEFDVPPFWTFGRLMKHWLKNDKLQHGDVQDLVAQLHKAEVGPGTRENVFIDVFTTTSHDSFNAIVAEYNRQYLINLRHVVKKEFSGHTEAAMLAAYDFNVHPANLCAQLVSHAVKGMGTDDTLLINVTALFRDRYYDWICQAYPGNIIRAIKRDTSGWYETGILELWNLKS
eukprot:EST44420.1 Annexin [Spironucleus salmonicida]